MADRTGLPFMFGVYGIEPMPETIKLLKESGACGVLLLRRNIETGEQVRSLVRALEDAVGHPLLVAIEHEGGLVTRFARDVSPFPGGMALGRTDTPSLAYEVGKGMARELLPLGINVNLAPVLDVSPQKWNPDITIRAFGSDPRLVAVMGSEMIRGMQEGGLSATAKYFPGRGSAIGNMALVDSAELEQHLLPFNSAIAKGVDLVMTTHTQYPAVDPTPDLPATFSAPIVHDLLRKRLGHRGVVISDDLSNPAAGPAEESAVRAAKAGHDILLFGHHTEMMTRAFQSYRLAVEKNHISYDHMEQVKARIDDLLRKHATDRSAFPVEDDTDPRSLSEIIAGASTHVERDPQKLIPLKRGTRAGVLFPRLNDVADKLVVDDELRGAAELIQGWIHEISPNVDVLEVPIDAKKDVFTMALEWSTAVEVVILFVFDAQQHVGQRRLLDEVQKRSKKVIVVPVRNPWDRDFVGPKNSVVQTYGFRVPQLAAAVDLIFRGSS